MSTPRPVRLFSALCASAILALSGAAQAANWRLAVPPFLPQAELQKQYAPLVEYLNASTGENFELVTSASYLGYWTTAQKAGAYDMALDNAPMTDFRAQRQGYTVLAKIAGVISQSLITSEKNAIFDPQELVGKKVSTVATPNLSALAMFQMFPNPMRQPDFVYANDARAAVDMVQQGQSLAAIVPTPIAIQFANVNLVATTEQIPHLAVSAAPSLPPEIQARVKKALLEADKSDLGKKVLTSLNTSGFEPASNATYRGYADWLKGTFGY